MQTNSRKQQRRISIRSGHEGILHKLSKQHVIFIYYTYIFKYQTTFRKQPILSSSIQSMYIAKDIICDEPNILLSCQSSISLLRFNANRKLLILCYHNNPYCDQYYTPIVLLLYIRFYTQGVAIQCTKWAYDND